MHPVNLHTVLFCFALFLFYKNNISGKVNPYLSRLLHWHWDNWTTAKCIINPVPTSPEWVKSVSIKSQQNTTNCQWGSTSKNVRRGVRPGFLQPKNPSHVSWRCDRMSDSTAIFRQACLAEVSDRIRNQVLVNRLTANSSKITKISWWEMLVNYRWNWCWLSWQISRLTFTCEHVQFEWLRLLHPANEAGIPSKFSSIN